MATKIRLQRFGRKNYAFYQIVIADSRAPRDGKFIERIGSYNPNTNPATIDLKFDRALYWLQVGAQPTDTTRMILSREGVCLKKHLLEGVKKGAFDEATANSKFEAWLQEKNLNLQKVKDGEREKKKATTKALLESEKEVNKAKAEALSKKRSDLAAEAAAAVRAEADAKAEAKAKAEAEAAEATAAEVAEVAATIEAAAVEEAAAPVEVEVAPVEEVVPVEEVTAPAEEVAAPAETEVAPAEEAAKEEAPAE